MPDLRGLLTKNVLRTANANSRPDTRNDTALLENAWGNRCCPRKVYLDDNESNKQYCRESQQCDDTPITPLEIVNTSESQNDGSGDSQNRSSQPTEVPTEGRLRQVSALQYQEHQVAIASLSRGASLYLGREYGDRTKR